jgi:hypothetical protein
MAKSVKEKLMDDVKPEQEEPEKDVKQQPSVDQPQPDANQQSQQEIVINGNFSVCFFFWTNSCRVCFNYSETRLLRTTRDRPFLFVITGARFNRVNLCMKITNLALKSVRYNRVFVVTEFHCKCKARFYKSTIREY